MKSKADYLSKYLSGPKDAKKKKKSKSANIVVDASVPSIKQVDLEDIFDDDEIDELRPIKVDLKSTKEFKGFKRIDGQEIKPLGEATDVAPPSLQPQTTVYRDSLGRIIDIEARRAEFETQKKQQEQEKEVREVRISEEEQLRQSKESFKPKKQDLDDPIIVFEGDTGGNDLGNQYTYNQGVNPVNRFGILAGCLWDGIDRSNGFEDLMMRKVTETRFKKIDGKINESYDDYEI
ncbi:uncharacterized protein CANTADRAFT_95873 [Suhomyces tanzawaensis NRRL Y-17324]|uniref:Pre-mRNA-splicing factor CWC26 n=1 Tax=Suhomyces tanzawaensis NRRL Y-17324 TaxID=984487 RepID=A0A1E4SFK1_9ASCO|nr:uncharacterized protein CANTADRAFT_95873 [Suhomyces tanzawaensis NRRL Y-17324]ODV78288.1 hypothetical protein CANTADRAFT_95873 [Suhomyces tanzawaensis NRRL Y-17324]